MWMVEPIIDGPSNLTVGTKFESHILHLYIFGIGCRLQDLDYRWDNEMDSKDKQITGTQRYIDELAYMSHGGENMLF